MNTAKEIALKSRHPETHEPFLVPMPLKIKRVFPIDPQKLALKRIRVRQGVKSIPATRDMIMKFITEHLADYPSLHAHQVDFTQAGVPDYEPQPFAPQTLVKGCYSCPYLTCPSHPDGHYSIEVPEVHRSAKGSVYWDYEVEETTVFVDRKTHMTVKIYKADFADTPTNRDDWQDVYTRPDLVESQLANAGIPAEKLRRTWRDLQDVVWILTSKPKVGESPISVARWKDLLPNGSIRIGRDHDTKSRIVCRYYATCDRAHLPWDDPKRCKAVVPAKFGFRLTTGGAQTPIHLMYVPNEVYKWYKPTAGPIKMNGSAEFTALHRNWHKIGSISEEQALHRMQSGPAVQPGKLTTSPYFESDMDDEYDDWGQDELVVEADYNGPWMD